MPRTKHTAYARRGARRSGGLLLTLALAGCTRYGAIERRDGGDDLPETWRTRWSADSFLENAYLKNTSSETVSFLVRQRIDVADNPEMPSGDRNDTLRYVLEPGEEVLLGHTFVLCGSYDTGAPCGDVHYGILHAAPSPSETGAGDDVGMEAASPPAPESYDGGAAYGSFQADGSDSPAHVQSRFSNLAKATAVENMAGEIIRVLGCGAQTVQTVEPLASYINTPEFKASASSLYSYTGHGGDLYSFTVQTFAGDPFAPNGGASSYST